MAGRAPVVGIWNIGPFTDLEVFFSYTIALTVLVVEVGGRTAIGAIVTDDTPKCPIAVGIFFELVRGQYPFT
jgi:hypothetical protein